MKLIIHAVLKLNHVGEGEMAKVAQIIFRGR